MKKLFDLRGTPCFDDMAVLPPIGEYYAIMVNYHAPICFIDEIQDTMVKTVEVNDET